MVSAFKKIEVRIWLKIKKLKSLFPCGRLDDCGGGDFHFSVKNKKEESIRKLIKSYSFLIPIRKLLRIMGCNCSKGIGANDTLETINNNNNVKERRRSKPNNKTSKKKKKSVSSSIVNNLGSEERVNKEDTLRFLIPIDAKNNALSSDEPDKKLNLERKSSKSLFQRRPTIEVGATLQQPKMTRISSVSNGERGAQVMAGWPSWLAAVAGEAINGWIPRKADSFEKLEKVCETFCLF